MSFTIKSSHQDERRIEANLDYLHKVHNQWKEDFKWTTILALLSAFFGGVLSLFASAVSVSGSVRSLFDSIKVRQTYVYFIAGILVFQLVLITIIWLVRKRNREIITLQNDLTDLYLSVINKSALNPNLKSSA
jgi:magnesium-transporting ATPase (P-type)